MSEHSVTLHFKEKKHRTKFLRQMKAGKGMVISHKNAHVGEGFLDGLKKVADSKITKGLVKTVVAPLAVKTMNGLAGPMAGQVTGAVLNEYTKGSGIFDNMKKVANSGIAKSIVKSVAPMVAQEIKNRTGSDLASNIAQGAMQQYATGSGVKKRGRPKKAAGPMSAKDRMAYVRSCRKKGGSFLPLG
jgi:hypothetical protein